MPRNPAPGIFQAPTQSSRTSSSHENPCVAFLRLPTGQFEIVTGNRPLGVSGVDVMCVCLAPQLAGGQPDTHSDYRNTGSEGGSVPMLVFRLSMVRPCDIDNANLNLEIFMA